MRERERKSILSLSNEIAKVSTVRDRNFADILDSRTTAVEETMKRTRARADGKTSEIIALGKTWQTLNGFSSGLSSGTRMRITRRAAFHKSR